MSFTVTMYAKKPYYVNAVCVTAENINDVAVWCSGEVRESAVSTHVSAGKNEKVLYIKVDVRPPVRAKFDPRMSMAFIGDWILLSETGWKVYTNKAFTSTFELWKGETQNS